MSLTDRITGKVREIAATAAGQLQAFASAPLIQNVGRASPGVSLTQDTAAQKVVESREALFGRVATRLGPVPSFVSTHPLRGLTPKRVSSIHNEVMIAGWMLNKACLDEDLLLGDSHLRSQDSSFRDSIVGAPWSIEPADDSELARQVADYQTAVFRNCYGFKKACRRLLYGNLAGYALEEAVYEDRATRFRLGKGYVTVECPTPVDFEWVGNRHTRFNLAAGDQLELDTGGGHIVPPASKFLRYEANDDFQLRRRGYAYTAIWLSMVKQNAWMRAAVMLDIWGIRGPWGKASKDLWEDKTRLQEMITAIQEWGTGKGVVVTEDFTIEASSSGVTGDIREMHMALISAINAEESKLINASTLTTDPGEHGSYGLSDTHADSKAARVQGSEVNLSDCVAQWMPHALRVACYRINPDGSFGDVNPRGLSAVLGAQPEDVIALSGRPRWRVQREMSPKDRMDLYIKAVNDLGMSLDDEAPYQDFGLKKARDGAEPLKGRTVLVKGGDLATATADAQQGVLNPKEETDSRKES